MGSGNGFAGKVGARSGQLPLATAERFSGENANIPSRFIATSK